MSYYLDSNLWQSYKWRFDYPEAGLAQNGYNVLGQEEEGALSIDIAMEGITEESTLNFPYAEDYAKFTGNEEDWKTSVNAKLTDEKSDEWGCYYTAKLNDAFSVKTKSVKTNENKEKVAQTITASHSESYAQNSARKISGAEGESFGGLKSLTLEKSNYVYIISRGGDSSSWSLSQTAYIGSDDSFSQTYKAEETDTAAGDIVVKGESESFIAIGAIEGYKTVTVDGGEFFGLDVVWGGNEKSTNNETYQASFVKKSDNLYEASEKITRALSDEESSQGKFTVGTAKNGMGASIGLGDGGYDGDEMGIHNMASVALYGLEYNQIYVGWDDKGIEGGNEKNSKTVSWTRGEKQEYNVKTDTYTITDTLKSSWKSTEEYSGTGDFTAQFADVEGDINGFQTVKLEVKDNVENVKVSNGKEAKSGEISATAILTVNDEASTLDVSFSKKYDESETSKAAGTFTASSDINASGGELTTGKSVKGYATVTLKNVQFGNQHGDDDWSEPRRYEYDDEVSIDSGGQYSWSSSDKFDYKGKCEVGWDPNPSDIVMVSKTNKYTEDFQSLGTFTLTNDNKEETFGLGVDGDISNYKSVKVVNGSVWDISAYSYKNSYSNTFTYAGETSSKAESYTGNYSYTETYGNASDVTLDNSYAGYIYGYDKVQLSNSSTASIVRWDVETESVKYTMTTDANAALTVNGTEDEKTKNGGTLTATSSYIDGIYDYATVKLKDCEWAGFISQDAEYAGSYKGSVTHSGLELVDIESHYLSSELAQDYEDNIGGEIAFEELDNTDAFNMGASYLDIGGWQGSGELLKKTESISESWTITGSVTLDNTYASGISGYKSVSLTNSAVEGNIDFGYLDSEYDQLFQETDERELLRGNMKASYSYMQDNLKEETSVKKAWTSTGELKMENSYVEGTVFYLQKVTVKGEDNGISIYKGSYGDDSFAVEKGSYFDADELDFDKGNDSLKIADDCDVEISSLRFGSGNDVMSIGANSEVWVGNLDYASLNKITIGKNSTLYVSDEQYNEMMDMRQYRNYCASGQIAIAQG